MAQRERPPKTGNGGGSYWQTCWQLWADQEVPAAAWRHRGLGPKAPTTGTWYPGHHLPAACNSHLWALLGDLATPAHGWTQPSPSPLAKPAYGSPGLRGGSCARHQGSEDADEGARHTVARGNPIRLLTLLPWAQTSPSSLETAQAQKPSPEVTPRKPTAPQALSFIGSLGSSPRENDHNGLLFKKKARQEVTKCEVTQQEVI
ncbi:uncharacterized protein LOC116874277 [Lontra canadensis]|uniref:uncharacterized protein LOC116874277 n=1 Tax=Lontra canadensis TaxID=76717 RepID=UPI0013F35CCB|nr:uncharacterized protein LOC116874277 [Lontra canadensis]